MAGPEFFQTRMGQVFYEGTMPRLVKALEEIAVGLGPKIVIVPEKPSSGDKVQRSTDELQGLQGWTDETLLELVLQWVDKSGQADALLDHLQEIADEENEEE